MSTADLPSAAEMNASFKLIEEHAPKVFTWRYERERPQLVTLYDKANTSQWVGLRDLDWATDVDPVKLVEQRNGPMMELARAAADERRVAAEPHGVRGERGEGS